MESSLINEVHLREVGEADLAIFFEQQLDPEANFMAAFAAKDPADQAAFRAKWEKILAQFLIVVGIRPLFARAAKDNNASVRILQKNGFRIKGEDKGFANARGKAILILRLD